MENHKTTLEELSVFQMHQVTFNINSTILSKNCRNLCYRYKSLNLPPILEGAYFFPPSPSPQFRDKAAKHNAIRAVNPQLELSSLIGN